MDREKRRGEERTLAILTEEVEEAYLTEYRLFSKDMKKPVEDNRSHLTYADVLRNDVSTYICLWSE